MVDVKPVPSTYEHDVLTLTYNIVPGEFVVVARPDILILEGRAACVAQLLGAHVDLSLYIDAAVRDIRRWYVQRLLRLRRTALSSRTRTSIG